MRELASLLLILAAVFFAYWAWQYAAASGQRCIDAGHSYTHCRVWGVIW